MLQPTVEWEECPKCGSLVSFSDLDEHWNTHFKDGKSEEGTDGAPAFNVVQCPVANCSKQMLSSELEEHLKVHR